MSLVPTLIYPRFDGTQTRLGPLKAETVPLTMFSLDRILTIQKYRSRNCAKQAVPGN